MASLPNGFLNSFVDFVTNDDPVLSEKLTITSDINKISIDSTPNNLISEGCDLIKATKASNKFNLTEKINSLDNQILSKTTVLNSPLDRKSDKISHDNNVQSRSKRKRRVTYSDDDFIDAGELEPSDDEWDSRKKNKKNSHKKSNRSRAKRKTNIDEDNNLYCSDSPTSEKVEESHSDLNLATESTKTQKETINEDDTSKLVEDKVRTESLIKSNPLLCSQQPSFNTKKTIGSNFKNFFMPQCNFIYDLKWTEPHFYRKGEFVVEKQEYVLNGSGFSLWRIDSGKLLEKYEQLPIENGRRYFKTSSTYSSWADSIKHRYKAVGVYRCNAEKVELLKVFIPKAEALFVDKSFEHLAYSFNVYVQILLSQSLEPTFLHSLNTEPVDYFTDSLNAIEKEFEIVCEKYKVGFNWISNFRECLETFSKCAIIESNKPTISFCQAFEIPIAKENFCVRFYGYQYDSANLEMLGEVADSNAQEFIVCKKAADAIPIFHVLSHIRLFFFSLCNDKILKLRKEMVEYEDDDDKMLDACLQNQNWMQQMFFTMAQILTRSKQHLEIQL